MKDQEKTKEQLIQELHRMRQRTAALAASETDRRRAEETLRESRAFLQTVLDAIPEVTMVIDRNYRIVLANRAARRMAGSADPVSGCLKCHQVSHHCDVPCKGLANPCPLIQVVETGTPLMVTHTHYDAQGNEVTVEVSAAPILDEAGEVVQIIESCRDITDRQRAEEALRRERDFAESLIETAHSIVLVLDIDGRIVRINPYMEQLSGYRHEEVRGKDWFEIFAPQRRRWRFRELFRKAINDEGVQSRISPIVTKSGLEREIAWWAKILKDAQGDIVGVLAIGRDITDLREAQERLVQAERLAAIGEAMTGLTHESRNALQRSQACLEMLADRVHEQPEARGLVDRIQEAQDHLHQLYEEVREYAAPIVLKPQRTRLSRLLQETWKSMASMRKGRRVRLREVGADLDLRCEVDGFAIERVFQNILENAMAACKDPVEIDVLYRVTEIDQVPAVQVAVRDNGPGLTPEQRQRIFDSFYTTKTQGTGLGMAIVKRIVEAHGGHVAVGSGSGPGTEILITLPRRIR